MGIRGAPLSWLRTFLCGRQQFASVDGVSSGMTDVTIGVPQGLGPLLLIIYINDMHLVADQCNVVHFADDTTFFHSHSDLSLAVSDINSDLLKIQRWLQRNRLSMYKKTTI